MSTYDRVRSVLIRRADPDGLAELKVADIARAARCSDRSVQYALRALVEEEDLILEEEARQHHPAVYRLTGRLTLPPAGRPVRALPGVQPGVQNCTPPRGAVVGVGGKPATGRGPRRRGKDRQRRWKPRSDETNPRALTRCPTHPDNDRWRDDGECAGCFADRVAYDLTLTRPG